MNVTVGTKFAIMHVEPAHFNKSIGTFWYWAQLSFKQVHLPGTLIIYQSQDITA